MDFSARQSLWSWLRKLVPNFAHSFFQTLNFYFFFPLCMLYFFFPCMFQISLPLVLGSFKCLIFLYRQLFIFFSASPVPGQTGTAALWRTDAAAGMVASFSNPAGSWTVGFLHQRSGNVPYRAGQTANARHGCSHPCYLLGISVFGQTNQRSGLRTKWLRTWDYECQSERWGGERMHFSLSTSLLIAINTLKRT